MFSVSKFCVTALVVSVTAFASQAAHADYVPPFKGNDTGGIISYNLVGTTDVDALAVSHCAYYGKVAVFRGAQRIYGGYLSFACKAVPIAYDRPLRVRY